MWKKVSVITVNPSSASSSKELTSITQEKVIFLFAEKRGAVCMPAKPFSKSILPEAVRSIKNWFFFLLNPMTNFSFKSLKSVSEKSFVFSMLRLILQGNFKEPVCVARLTFADISMLSATTADFVTDVESGIAYLKTRKEINKNKIGLMGHSEGGTIAPIVASTSKDVNFIILLAGTGLRGDKLLLIQEELIARASGTPETAIQQTREINTKLFDMVIKSNNTETLKADLTKYLNAASTNNQLSIDENHILISRYISFPKTANFTKATVFFTLNLVSIFFLCESTVVVEIFQ